MRFLKDQKTARYCDTVKRKQKPTKMGEYAKNHENVMKTVCSKNRDKFRKLKPLAGTNCSSLDKGCDLSIEMLSYKLTKIRFKIFTKIVADINFGLKE